MKGDFTRLTFNPEKHYSRVLMQQGRVQLDADWNEQLDIAAHRIETEAADTLGNCAAPMHDAAFGIVTDPDDLPVEERQRLEDLGLLPLQTGDFILTHGRFYVDGILCENEHAVPFSAQPDLPGAEPVSDPGTYLAYLDVWQRHITFLEAPLIREVALGGPDTATRARTIWQVRLLPVEGAELNCLSELEAWNDTIAASTGKLSARAQPETTSTDPCIVPPSAGFRGLQNQLYRVEIHAAGELGDATFKWSRDNGSLVFAIEEFMDGMPTDRIRLRSLGRDKDLALRVGDWVEALDDNLELNGTPGTLAQITDIDTDDLIITLDQDISELDTNRHPKVRRWDSVGALDVEVPGGNDGFIPLEEGVEVKFEAGFYHTGDYWLVPARTILGNPELTQTGGIEWPMDGADPIPQSPLGIDHHYCRLALLTFNGTTFVVEDLEDCRPLFPPATELVELFYLGGDGQETMPGEMLAKPLRAGVSNGQWPVAGASVRFHILEGGGTLSGGGSSGSDITVPTGADGVASVTWQLDGTTLSQLVEATLLNAASDPEHLSVHYNASLSIASQVAYSTNCEGLQEAGTVQEALDLLCANAALYYVSGDGQSGMLGQQLPFPLEVRLSNGHWPVAGEKVIFKVVQNAFGQLTGGGMTGTEVPVTTDENGYAACTWRLGTANNSQQVIAFWDKQPGLFIHFNAAIIEQTQNPTLPAIHIVDVLIAGRPLEFNSVNPVAALKEGIQIVLDENIEPPTLEDRLACTVTIDMPFPLNPMDVEFYDPVLVGFQPLRLHANLSVERRGNIIHWMMEEGVDQFLFRLLSRVSQLYNAMSLEAHLTLKGNFIFGVVEEPVYIDADAFALPPGISPTGLKLPSGDGIPGGFFETWFRLVEG